MYGVFVETMGHYLGQFFRALDDLGLGETTFIVFLSDMRSSFASGPVHAHPGLCKVH